MCKNHFSELSRPSVVLSKLLTKEYTYQTKTEKALENLKSKAIEEDYFDNAHNEFDSLVNNVKNVLAFEENYLEKIKDKFYL